MFNFGYHFLFCNLRCIFNNFPLFSNFQPIWNKLLSKLTRIENLTMTNQWVNNDRIDRSRFPNEPKAFRPKLFVKLCFFLDFPHRSLHVPIKQGGWILAWQEITFNKRRSNTKEWWLERWNTTSEPAAVSDWKLTVMKLLAAPSVGRNTNIFHYTNCIPHIFFTVWNTPASVFISCVCTFQCYTGSSCF